VVYETRSVFNVPNTQVVKMGRRRNSAKADLLGYLWSRREERVAPYAYRVKVRFTEHVDTMSEQTLNP